MLNANLARSKDWLCVNANGIIQFYPVTWPRLLLALRRSRLRTSGANDFIVDRVKAPADCGTLRGSHGLVPRRPTEEW